jgi:hypothetical protein
MAGHSKSSEVKRFKGVATESGKHFLKKATRMLGIVVLIVRV